MRKETGTFVKALAVFIGTIIGVGLFGLPYVASKAGFFIIVLYFFLLGFIAILIHLLFGEVVLGTKEIKRLPGYVGEYLGENWKKVAFLIIALGLFGALLAYLIVGGEFLNFYFSPFLGGNSSLYTFLFFSFGAFLIFRGIKSISQIELTLFIVFLIILSLLSLKAFPFINAENLQNLDLNFLIFPFGIVLFALWGNPLVPEIKEMVGGDRKQLRRVIFWGITISVLIYLFFTFLILGVCGSQTSETALGGFSKILGNGIIKLGFIFGFITCFTSFITLGLTLKKVFWYDFGLSKNLSWFIVCFFPLGLFFLGIREFIEIISFTGAIAIGLEGIIVILLYRKFLEKKFSQKMNPFLYFLPLVLVLGILFEIFFFLT